MTKFKALRLSKKISNAKIAQLTGLTRQAISHVNNHGIKTVNTAKKYAEVLDCDWKDLLG